MKLPWGQFARAVLAVGEVALSLIRLIGAGLTIRSFGKLLTQNLGYRPYNQICWGVLTLAVRTQRDPADITRAIRAELDRFDKDVPLENVRTMSQLVSANVAQRRLSVQLLGGFAGSALGW